MIIIRVSSGVAQVEKCTNPNEEIVIKDEDSQEVDYYKGTIFWQRLNLSEVE